MSSTLNKIADNIVDNGIYLTHNEIISWAKCFKEYEVVIKIMQEHNLCTITNEVTEVRQRQFYQAPVYGGTGQTVTMEAASILRSRNEERVVRVHDLASSKFSHIVEEVCSTQIAAKRLKREQIERDYKQKCQQESQDAWDRLQRGKAEYERMQTYQREKYPPIHHKPLNFDYLNRPRLQGWMPVDKRDIRKQIEIINSQTEEEFNQKLGEAFYNKQITSQDLGRLLEQWKTRKLQREAERKLKEQKEAELQAKQADGGCIIL